ncbi:MAG: hypothetical protein HYV97_10070 [Bdellovibrio sp.]|nr:hypothetical protein [Bdellovibrio sp.]
MFKLLLLAFLYLNVALALAQTSQKTIEYTGQSEDIVDLFSTQTHTEYTYEDVVTTCSRQIQDGYETICYKHLIEKRRICQRIDGRTICSDDGSGNTDHGDNGDHSNGDDDDDDSSSHTTCYDRPTYRTEYYSCVQVISHPYEVFDFNTEGKASVKFSPWPSELTPSKASVTVNLNSAGALSANADAGQSPVFIFGEWRDEVREDSGEARKVSATLNVSFQNATEILAPLQSSIRDIALNNQEVSFLVTKGSNVSDYELEFKAKKVRWFILKDKEIVKTKLNASQFKITSEGDQWRIHVPLLSLGKFEIKAKYRFEFALKLGDEIKDRLLNQQQFPTTKTEGKFKGRFQ